MVEIRWKLQYYWVLLYDMVYAKYVSLWRKCFPLLKKYLLLRVRYKLWQRNSALDKWHKIPIAEHFKTAPTCQIVKGYIRFSFYEVNFGMGLHRMDSAETWIHELTEHALGKLGTIMSDVVELRGVQKGCYDVTVKHLMAALCTESDVDGTTLDGDQFAEYFGFS